MTWRTFAYWFVFVVPVLIVAAATGSEPEPTGDATAPVVAWMESPFEHLSDPLRSASLIAGTLAVGFTFLRMWQNLRGRA